MREYAVTLNTPDDWIWYRAGIDVDARHRHDHGPTPKEYPCKVESATWEDDLGWNVRHDFTYRQTVACEKCQHITTVWPHEKE